MFRVVSVFQRILTFSFSAIKKLRSNWALRTVVFDPLMHYGYRYSHNCMTLETGNSSAGSWFTPKFWIHPQKFNIDPEKRFCWKIDVL